MINNLQLSTRNKVRATLMQSMRTIMMRTPNMRMRPMITIKMRTIKEMMVMIQARALITITTIVNVAITKASGEVEVAETNVISTVEAANVPTNQEEVAFKTVASNAVAVTLAIPTPAVEADAVAAKCATTAVEAVNHAAELINSLTLTDSLTLTFD